MPHRQKLLFLYLESSALDSRVVAWSYYDGTGTAVAQAGDSDDPPYRTGLEALTAGWRLIQANPLQPHAPGAEFSLSYLKYEFIFEQWLVVTPEGTEVDHG
ncbi:MAG: hypothetical protein AAGI15_00025 [Pseudomonadota bacterium]